MYQLDKDSVDKLKQELEENVDKAKADLDAVNAEQRLSKSNAEYTYKINLEYGSYAQTEYDNSVQEL